MREKENKRINITRKGEGERERRRKQKNRKWEKDMESGGEGG